MTSSSPAQVMIGLDVGTTDVKAAAFGLGSGWRSVAIREYPLLRPAPGEEVQDPATILTASGDALAECVAAAGSAHVLAVSVSTGMHGLMALDGELRPLTQLITWADARARHEARSLRQSGQAAELQALTGVPVHPMTPLTKLMWFARHDPHTWKDARWWVGLKDYILLWLTGRLVTELSSASGTGLLEMSTQIWCTKAIELCGVDAHRLPPILPTTATLALAAATASKVGLAADTPVVVGAGDGPLGNLGTGAMSPGVAGLSLGTSGAVRMAVDTPQVDAGGTLFCYALTDSVWVIGGAISNGGSVLRWAGGSLAPDVQVAAGAAGADAAVLELAGSVPAGSDGLVMLPYLLAERAPLWDPDLPGAYLGLRRAHSRAHLLRAAVEGVCLQMRIILDQLGEVKPVSSVRATGGVFRSALWREVMAATLGRPVHIVEGAEGTALGAAALGLFALGRAPTLTDAVARLADPGAEPTTPVEADPQLVATYDRVRASVPELIDELGGVASLLRVGGDARPAAGR
jgi:gluconokinase